MGGDEPTNVPDMPVHETELCKYGIGRQRGHNDLRGNNYLGRPKTILYNYFYVLLFNL